MSFVAFLWSFIGRLPNHGLLKDLPTRSDYRSPSWASMAC
jgi:hypothetical protein